MRSVRSAIGILVVEVLVLVSSVVVARAFAETPWLLLPFIFAFMAGSTFVVTTRKLGSIGLLMQVVSLASFYGVVFAPREIGWSAAGAFGASVIAFGVIVLFDNWLWPDRADPILVESVGASLARQHARFIEGARFYLRDRPAHRPPVPPASSDLPAHLTLLDRVVAEGATRHRQAVLLAAVTRAERVQLEVTRFIIAAREDVALDIRELLRPEIEGAVEAIAAALDQIAHEESMRAGVDEPPLPAAVRARSMMDALDARVIEARPLYYGRVSAGENSNFASFLRCLAALTRHIERPLDEPPSTTEPSSTPVSEPTDAPDRALLRYCMKVGFCTIIGYLIGLSAQRPQLSVILTTIVITALPSYGRSLRKMIQRIVGAILGGLMALLMIIIVTPNFETLPAYLLAVSIVLYLAAYAGLSSGRIAYAGSQIGTTFVLAFGGLSPSADIYAPLWRIWAVLIGTLVVTVVFLVLWPEYAGDSLLPRLRKVIRKTLAVAPGGSASTSESGIEAANSETMRTLAEILEVADDARLEGRASMIDHDSVVQAAGTLRKIANRLGYISLGRIATVAPPLDDPTELAREAVIAAIRARIESWRIFYEEGSSYQEAGAVAPAMADSRDQVLQPLEEFSRRLEAGGFEQIVSWTLDQRRMILSELHSLRRLEVLLGELDGYLSAVGWRAPDAATSPSYVPSAR
jgi:uncharacterized membrane protein YccC